MTTTDPLAAETSPPLASPPPPIVTETETSTIILSATPPRDPPPPYPSRERRIRSPRQNRRRRAAGPDADHPHLQIPTSGNDSDHEGLPLISPYPPSDDGDHDTSEATPLLPPSSNTAAGAHSPRLLHGGIRRQRTLSISSTVRSSTSIAPSFAQTVLSAFQPDRDSDLDPDCDSGGNSTSGNVQQYESATAVDFDYSRFDSSAVHHFVQDQNLFEPYSRVRRRQSFGTICVKYFRPLARKAYYSALLHLMCINFPYALFAWIYLFVFTLAGTTTLMALPLGAVLCFIDLLGARLFARGELCLQTTYHGPLGYPPPFPPHPIFTRLRPPTTEELEAGRTGLTRERSFYRNAYAMFTDSTSYQALFYFLIIKPGITLLLTIFLWIFVPVCMALIIPAPAMLRLVRRLGIWQANVAVEGLYYAVR